MTFVAIRKYACTKCAEHRKDTEEAQKPRDEQEVAGPRPSLTEEEIKDLIKANLFKSHSRVP